MKNFLPGAVMVLLSSSVLAQQVLVRSHENPALEIGQGWLTHYDGRCLVILPTHVARETGGTAALLREGAEPLLGETTGFAELGDDLSVARVSGTVTSECGYGLLAISRAVEKHIRANPVAAVRSVNGDGSVAQTAVTVVDDDAERFLRVQPTHDATQLRKGQSGSLLMASDTPVGMLLSVNARFGVGKVIRLDRLLEKVEREVAGGSAAPASGASGGAAGKRGSGRDGEVIGWSVLPTDGRHRAANLTATGDAPPWSARVEQWPVTIDIDLPGERVALAGFELDGRDVAEPGQLPAGVELLLSATEDRRRWRSVTGTTLQFEEGIAMLQFAPAWARHARFVFTGAADGGDVIALGRIRALKAR